MEITRDGIRAQLPDMMLIGAAKSGTTSVAHQFLIHPHTFLPVEKKEPHYFSFADKAPPYQDEEFVKTLVWQWKDYVDLYAEAPAQTLMTDCSTSYLYRHDTAIPHIRSIYGEQAKDLRIAAILRDPVDRAFSHWMYLVRNGHEDLSFEEAIRPEVMERRKQQRWGFDYLGYGAYAEGIHRFKSEFPHFKVFLFEDLRKLQSMFDVMCDFLEVEHFPVQQVRSNPGGIPKSRGLVRLLRRGKLLRSLSHLAPDSWRAKMRAGRDGLMQHALERPVMPPAARAYLNAYYREDVARLSGLIDRNLDHWCRA